jgi:uncharacterized protein (TIGR03083 family)
MKPLEPIHVTDLFRPLREGLLVLLNGLSAEEWERPTVCAGWSVKDVASHLLAGDIGVLSRRRDRFAPASQAVKNWEDLVALINCLNASWVEATKRISPRLLCDLLEFTGPQVEAFFSLLDPNAKGVPVDWAGPEPAPVWMDLAREYTERWHHQQQIRDAVAKPGFKERRFFAPVLDAFVRALPHTFRNVSAADGTTVKLRITGDSGGAWLLRREAGAWLVFCAEAEEAAAEVEVAPDDAWRLFTKGLKPEQARARVQLRGELGLAKKVLETVSVIA